MRDPCKETIFKEAPNNIGVFQQQAFLAGQTPCLPGAATPEQRRKYQTLPSSANRSDALEGQGSPTILQIFINESIMRLPPGYAPILLRDIEQYRLA